MPSINPPPKHIVPIPGKVPVPMLEEPDEKPSGNKIMIGIAVALGLMILILLLLLLFAFARPSMNAGGSGSGTGGAGAGQQTGDNAGNSNGDGSKMINGQSGQEQKAETAATEAEQSSEDESRKNTAEATKEVEAAKETIAEDGVQIPEVTNSTNSSDQSPLNRDDKDVNDDETGGGSGSGGGGLGDGRVTVQVFGVGGQGTKFMYVFDRSSSMTGQKLQEVKKELLKSLSVLNAEHKFNIIFYDDQFEVWKPGRKLIPAKASNKKEAEKYVQNIAARGSTSHLPPLLEAIEYKPEVIFFLTDGQALTQQQLEEICRKSGNICINVIQYDGGSDGKSEILRQLASRNRGQYKYINVATSDAL